MGCSLEIGLESCPERLQMAVRASYPLGASLLWNSLKGGGTWRMGRSSASRLFQVPKTRIQVLIIYYRESTNVYMVLGINSLLKCERF